jgi:hypothetical protein
MYAKIMMVLSGLCLSSAVLSSELTADEKAVWQMEESYWLYVVTNDTDSYAKLWNDRFIGWPGFSKVPLGKKNATDWIQLLHANSDEVYDYELQQESVRSYGDVVATHYLVHQVFRSASSGEVLRKLDPVRITHTWQRTGNSWQIVTGMSATLIDDDGNS